MNEIEDLFGNIKQEFGKIDKVLDVFEPVIGVFKMIQEQIDNGWDRFVMILKIILSVTSGTSSCLILCIITINILSTIAFLKVLKSSRI